jgi:hypothetical protein
MILIRLDWGTAIPPHFTIAPAIAKFQVKTLGLGQGAVVPSPFC